MFETTKLGKYGIVVSAAEAARALIERWPFDTGDPYKVAPRMKATQSPGFVNIDTDRNAVACAFS